MSVCEWTWWVNDMRAWLLHMSRMPQDIEGQDLDARVLACMHVPR